MNKVRVKYGAGECEDATIQKVNVNETFDIVFDDGHFGTKKDVPLNEIRIQNVSGVYSYFILFCSFCTFCSLFPYALLFCSHIFFSSVLFVLLSVLFPYYK